MVGIISVGILVNEIGTVCIVGIVSYVGIVGIVGNIMVILVVGINIENIVIVGICFIVVIIKVLMITIMRKWPASIPNIFLPRSTAYGRGTIAGCSCTSSCTTSKCCK
jgi:hypothetical protein